MIVRLATKKDFKYILKLFYVLDVIHKENRRGMRQNISINRYKNIISKSYEDPDKIICVLEKTDNIVGFSISLIKTTKGNYLYEDNKRGYINYLLIEEKHRSYKAAKLL